MTYTWKLQEVEQRLHEVVQEALLVGPQLITQRDVESVVLISYTEYRRLTLTQQKLSAFFRESPLVRAGLDLQRDTSHARQEPQL